MSKRTTAAATLSLLAAAALLGPAVHAQQQGVRLGFEKRPRPVLARTAGVAASQDPQAAIRASGAIYLLAVDTTAPAAPAEKTAGMVGHGGMGGDGEGAGRLIVCESRDGGDTFSRPIPVSKPGAQVVGHGENGPRLAYGSGGMYALWEQRRADGGTDLMCAGSRMGTQWSEPVRVNDEKATPSSNTFSSLTVAPNGDVYAVWLDGRDRGKGTLDVYLARSTDAGKTFGKNVRVVRGACPCCRPAVAVTDDGAVHVAYRNVTEGDIRDIYLTTSTDSGATFPSPARVAEDGWKIGGCPHTGPSLLARDGRLFCSWYSDGAAGAGKAGVRLALSADGGKTFGAPVLASRGLLDANHPSLFAGEYGRLFVVFQARDARASDGWGPLEAYVGEVSAAAGAKVALGPLSRAPGRPESAGGGPATYPAAVADAAGRVWVFWNEQAETGDGRRQVVLSRGREGFAAPPAAPARQATGRPAAKQGG
jgi:hypothetical protein